VGTVDEKVRTLTLEELECSEREGLLHDTALLLEEVQELLSSRLMGSEREKLDEARAIVLRLKTLEEESGQ